MINIIWAISLSLYKPSPIYLLDEVYIQNNKQIDEALDENNQRLLGELIKKYLYNKKNQVIYISHHKTFINYSNEKIMIKKINDSSRIIN